MPSFRHHEMTLGAGLKLTDFVLDKDLSKNGDPHWWPHLTVAPDRGPGGIAALHFLQNFAFANVEVTPDASHDSWNSVKEMCREAGMWGVVLLTMLVYNLPHGPFSEDTRFQQTREAVAEMIATRSAEDSALFNDMVGDIRWEMSFDEGGEGLSDNDIWDMIPTMECFQKKGYRVNANRFMGWVKLSTKEAPQWTMRKLVYTYIAIEADMLAGKNLRTLVAKPVELGAVDGTTAVGKAAGEEKVLRAACQNTLVMAVLILGDVMNRLRVRAMVALTKPLLRHFEQQSHELRSAVASMEWQGRQVQGEVFCAISGACSVLTSAQALTWMGVRLPVEGAAHFDESILVEEDGKPELLGLLLRAQLGAFFKRTIWLWGGWPSKMVEALQPEPRRPQVVNEFKANWDAYQELAGHCDAPQAQKWLDRSLFRKATNINFVNFLSSSNWVAQDDFIELLHRRHQRVMSSQIVEDGINRAKNAGRKAASYKYSPPEKAMALCSVRRVLGEVHSYKETVGAPHLLPATAKLPAQTFRPQLRQADPLLKDIVSTQRTTSWVSPGAAGLAIEFADTHVVRQVVEEGSYHCLRHSWLCILLSFKHEIAVRRRAGPDRSWMLPLAPIRESAALALRLLERDVPGHDGKVYFKVAEGAPVVLPVLRHDDWEACDLAWHSPLRSQKLFPRAGWAFWSSVMPFMASSPRPLMKVAAAHGFWTIPKAYLVKLCDLMGLDLGSGSSLFDICFSLVQFCGGGQTDEEIMTCLKHRKVLMTWGVGCVAEELMEVDEASAMFDKDEQGEFQEEKNEAKTRLGELSSFRQGWKQKKEVIRSKASSSGSGGQRSRKKAAVGKVTVPRRQLPTDCDITQEPAKEFLPPPTASCGNLMGAAHGAPGRCPTCK